MSDDVFTAFGMEEARKVGAIANHASTSTAQGSLW
ncbi:MAG: hypothetical protein ACJAXW_002470 [Candidatus Azotimanducaceae bacterium]|jgi:hypothetical protein